MFSARYVTRHEPHSCSGVWCILPKWVNMSGMPSLVGPSPDVASDAEWGRLHTRQPKTLRRGIAIRTRNTFLKAIAKNILLVQSTLLFLIGHVDPVLPEPNSIDEKDVFPRGSFPGPSMAPRSNGPRPMAADSHRQLNNFTMRTFVSTAMHP